MPVDLPKTLTDFENQYLEALPEGTVAYYSGAAADELTLRRNARAWEEITFRPRVMVDVSSRDPSVELFGTRYGLPIAVAPTAEVTRWISSESSFASSRIR